MNIFYGTAIQGCNDALERVHINAALIEAIKAAGHDVVSEHTTGKTAGDRARLLEQSIGPLPPPGLGRTAYIRNRMINAIEGDIHAAIFEVSVPSLGTGIEIAHAYLRPRSGLKEIPVLALYQDGYWKHDLSAMIRGISNEAVRCFSLREYKDPDHARQIVQGFLMEIG